ncbi:MAG TPA: choice-of-anchor tandem repeat NxxGxxAF-containing protein [Lacipirellulaceae bacterium]|nr:choice-of-anchor tandem repeat NxxGxxAF-containing protein [Lacipirellulaceae bacterium]
MLVRLVLVALLTGLPLTARGALSYRTVALSGTQAPGTPAGAMWNSFSSPMMSAAGGTAFFASLQPTGGGVTSTNNAGIWSEASGALALVARVGGGPTPSNGQTVFDSLRNLVANASGRIALVAPLRHTGSINDANDSGLFLQGSAGVSPVAREGGQAPALLAGTQFDDLSFATPVINASGRVAFAATLKSNLGDVDSSNDQSLWSDRTGALALVLREGYQAPGTPAGAFFRHFGAPVLNASDRMAFVATLQTVGGGVTEANAQGIWTEGSGALSLLARRGNAAPGATSLNLFRDFGQPAMNAAGRVVFPASVRFTSGGISNGLDSGIWSDRTGSLALVARAASQAPGTPVGAIFGTFFGPGANVRPVINASGRTAFSASLRMSGGGVTETNNSGIWSDGSGTLALVAREGSQAPGTPAGSRFGDFAGWAPVINSSGRIAFFASLQPNDASVNAGNDAGIWAENQQGVLTLVAREGDLFQVAPGDLRTLASLSFGEMFRRDERRTITFTDDFKLAFAATFTDGSSGVFTATLAVPEPAAIQILLAAFLAAVIGGRRNGRVLRTRR